MLCLCHVCCMLLSLQSWHVGSVVSSCRFCEQLWTREGRGWSRAASSDLKVSDDGVAELYMEMLMLGKHSQLADFDDHLNDISK